ncbi:AAA family ATPase [Antribacter gilvus]|uniref:AAA family ATPase n=1 Tax=Antribacter gilvus TaxID=2304675 RepID=UPI0013E087BB|nr:AAA family ATPase [Antribacter gilvus]
MPQLLVVTGPPGSGKSTVTAALADRWDPSVLVEGDAFFRFLRRGAVTPWLPESHAQNETTVLAASAAAGRFAAGGMTVVYDGVVGPWFLPRFAGATGLQSIDYVILLPPLETCLDRVSTREGHEFTDLGAAHHLYEDFARAIADGTPGLVLADLPEDVAGVADRIVDAIEHGWSRVEVAAAG